MSHLNTKQDNEMIFEKEEYNRLLLPLIASYVALVVSLALGLATFVAQPIFGQTMMLAYLGLEAAIFIVSFITVLRLKPVLAHRRRIRDGIGGLVHVLDHQLEKLDVNENMVFGTDGLVFYNIVRRGTGNWLVQIFNVGDDITGTPVFEAVTMKYRLAKVTDPSQAIRYTPYVLSLINSVHAVIASQCEGAALVEIVHSHNSSAAMEAIDELEELVNRQA